MKRAWVLLIVAVMSGAVAVVSREWVVWLAVPGKLVGMLVHSASATLTLIVTLLFYFGFFFGIALWLEQRRERGAGAR